jgi:serine/threonine protein kinase
MADEQDTGEDGQPRTVFMPGQTIPPAPASVPPSAPAAPVAGRTYMPMAPRTDGDRIQVGDVLNHIFEVKRFLARGGMGEVFEGINVSSDERVAIKVMLPALAADPNVQAMFRKEARTLTRLSHPALVQYRVLAQEPQLGVLYIVTEFIDGANLCDVLATLKPTGADIRLLARRLADGLRVAHSLGAIHRDISPDNVLLEGGRLEAAKVIDFGIAKDLDPSTKTIVGDGFAGKLNYVAPEQLGDFGRMSGHGATFTASGWCCSPWRRGVMSTWARPWSMRSIVGVPARI